MKVTQHIYYILIEYNKCITVLTSNTVYEFGNILPFKAPNIICCIVWHLNCNLVYIIHIATNPNKTKYTLKPKICYSCNMKIYVWPEKSISQINIVSVFLWTITTEEIYNRKWLRNWKRMGHRGIFTNSLCKK